MYILLNKKPECCWCDKDFLHWKKCLSLFICLLFSVILYILIAYNLFFFSQPWKQSKYIYFFALLVRIFCNATKVPNIHQFFLLFKVRLSSSQKNCAICLIESPLEMMKYVFYFFVLKVLKFLSQHFGRVTAWWDR